MKMEHWIRAIAGTIILVSLALGRFHNKRWRLLTAFAGINLLQSAFTKWCLMEDILDKLGVAKKSRGEVESNCCDKPSKPWVYRKKTV
jgi:hypothetical protein